MYQTEGRRDAVRSQEAQYQSYMYIAYMLARAVATVEAMDHIIHVYVSRDRLAKQITFGV